MLRVKQQQVVTVLLPAATPGAAAGPPGLGEEGGGLLLHHPHRLPPPPSPPGHPEPEEENPGEDDPELFPDGAVGHEVDGGVEQHHGVGQGHEVSAGCGALGEGVLAPHHDDGHGGEQLADEEDDGDGDDHAGQPVVPRWPLVSGAGGRAAGGGGRDGRQGLAGSQGPHLQTLTNSVVRWLTGRKTTICNSKG